MSNPDLPKYLAISGELIPRRYTSDTVIPTGRLHACFDTYEYAHQWLDHCGPKPVKPLKPAPSMTALKFVQLIHTPPDGYNRAGLLIGLCENGALYTAVMDELLDRALKHDTPGSVTALVWHPLPTAAQESEAYLEHMRAAVMAQPETP
jgi:hypothetical protein